MEAPVEEAEPAPVETHWWDGRAGWSDAQVGTYSTLFGIDVEAVKTMISDSQSYNLFDTETEAHLLAHQEIGAADLNLERELQPAQYRQLVAEYGRPVHITMEKIDTDGGGMDKVAVRYEGGKGSFTYEQEAPNGGGSVAWYLQRFLKDDWDELRPIFEKAGKL